jgi:hypothetical protein
MRTSTHSSEHRRWSLSSSECREVRIEQHCRQQWKRFALEAVGAYSHDRAAGGLALRFTEVRWERNLHASSTRSSYGIGANSIALHSAYADTFALFVYITLLGMYWSPVVTSSAALVVVPALVVTCTSACVTSYVCRHIRSPQRNGAKIFGKGTSLSSSVHIRQAFQCACTRMHWRLYRRRGGITTFDCPDLLRAEVVPLGPLLDLRLKMLKVVLMYPGSPFFSNSLKVSEPKLDHVSSIADS